MKWSKVFLNEYNCVVTLLNIFSFFFTDSRKISVTNCNLAMMETRTWSDWNKDGVMMTDWPVAGEWGMTNRRNLLMRPLLQNAGIWTLSWLQFGWSFLSLVWWTSLFQKQLETWTRQTTARTFPPCIFSGCCWLYGFRFASVDVVTNCV